MTDTLLRSLRERILDEEEPLAGLLRKCLPLGAETGSVALRDWARSELTGYGNQSELPTYRRLPSPMMSFESINQRAIVSGQMCSRLQTPAEVRECISEWFELHQPIDELEALSKTPSLSFRTPEFSRAEVVWSRLLPAGQQISHMSYQVAGSTISGILGQIRTRLVEVVVDLTMNNPLSELPQKDKVDAAVKQHIGAQYNTTIHTVNGPTAIGTKAQATAKGLSVADAIKLLDAVQRAASSEIRDVADQADLLSAIADLRAVVEQDTPDTGEVVKKVGRLNAVAERVGVPTLTSAVGGAVDAFTSLALAGAFG